MIIIIKNILANLIISSVEYTFSSVCDFGNSRLNEFVNINSINYNFCHISLFGDKK